MMHDLDVIVMSEMRVLKSRIDVHEEKEYYRCLERRHLQKSFYII